ncbi:MAG: biotin--[Clostridia bacterium]|nr:biotin--[acetyl-CoA-carboxylase] ligase [Clostridia bacterium]
MEYKITKYSELLSTNTKAAELGEFSHLECIVAERQTSGRGRMGRSFYSEGGGLYMSVLLDPSRVKCTLPLVTFAAAVSLREALASLGFEVGIKWVNDILYSGKKAAGILTEAKTKNGEIERIIVGIGVNLISPEGGFPDEIKNKATAIGYMGDKDVLIKLILSGLCENLSRNSDELMELYRKNMLMIGKVAEVSDYRSGEKKTVKILGVDNDGSLVCEDEEGNALCLVSGEVLY